MRSFDTTKSYHLIGIRTTQLYWFCNKTNTKDYTNREKTDLSVQWSDSSWSEVNETTCTYRRPQFHPLPVPSIFPSCISIPLSYNTHCRSHIATSWNFLQRLSKPIRALLLEPCRRHCSSYYHKPTQGQLHAVAGNPALLSDYWWLLRLLHEHRRNKHITKRVNEYLLLGKVEIIAWNFM